MRRRLVLSSLLISVLAVTVFAIPLAVVANRLIFDEARQRMQRDSDAIATSVEIYAERGQPVVPRDIARTYPDRDVLIAYPSGRMVTIGRAPSEEELRVQTRAPDGTLVVVGIPRDAVEQQALTLVLAIALLGLLAVGVSVGFAFVEARRLTVPFRDLAMRADRLGSGETLPVRRRYGLAELDTVAEVLDNSAVRIASFLAAERQFATDASHQLRTPLTALSMRLEEIASAADDPEAVAEEAQAALAQVQRLTEVVEQLLATARSGRDAEIMPTGLDEVIDQQLAEWEPAFRRKDRALVFEGERGLWARASKAGLSQVIATLLDNALVHGAGTTTVKATATGSSVMVEVADSGEGVPLELTQHIFDRHVSGGSGTGLGLALARSLAEADGGRLTLVRARPAKFAVFLRPVRDEAPPRRVVGGPA
ncbi:MAG: two-component sensor histidine kinase [Streptosporangiales bacterium]|nr:two-component sensor histidine kinase [Streptosporangiales bacterium]MBO0891205.1 two-component sensor histidine kinase [Acidothermales bacterium]